MPFPSLPIEVFGQRGSIKLQATVDTGFFGELCIPLDVATKLGLVLIDKMYVGLANGQKAYELVYDGEVKFLGAKQPVSIFIFEREDALIGVKLMEECQLVIDFPTQKLNLFRTAQSK